MSGAMMVGLSMIAVAGVIYCWEPILVALRFVIIVGAVVALVVAVWCVFFGLVELATMILRSLYHE